MVIRKEQLRLWLKPFQIVIVKANDEEQNIVLFTLCKLSTRISFSLQALITI